MIRLPVMIPNENRVTVQMIADHYGVQPRTVHMWRYRHPDFPKPIGRFAHMPLFEWTAVQAWKENRA